MEKLEELQSGRLEFDEAELEYLSALYDGGVLECDRQVGAFLDTLEELGLRDRTLVVVTSDHGEELGEHYPSYSGDHGHCLLDTLVRVPLIIHDPRVGLAAGSRIPHQVRLMDVMPTVVEMLGASAADDLEGASLLPLMRGEAESGRPAYGGQTSAGPDRMFLRYLGYKYIQVQGPAAGTYPLAPPPPDLQLYDLRADPGERANIGARELSVASKMRTILNRIKGSAGGEFAMPDPDSMDAGLRERLESLGYTR
jgi:arylsulfatase A-like enzyme